MDGGLKSSNAAVGEDDINRRVHDMKAGDAEIHNDLCGISDDYLIDVEFSEDSRGMGSISKIPLPNFPACKPEFLGTSHPSEATDDHEDPQLHILPHHNFDNGIIPVDDKWSNFSTSFALEDVSVHPTNHSFYHKDNSNMFLYYDFSNEGISTPSTLNQYGEHAIPQGSTQPLTDNMFLYYNFSESEPTSSPLPLDTVAEESTLPSSADDVPMPQKRIRKPTRRYIDESVDIALMSSKKRKLPTSKDKRIKDKTDTLPVNLTPEEFVVKPIQVPFGSLVTCKNTKVLNSDDESEATKLTSNEDEDQKERDHVKKLRHKHNDSKEYDDNQRVSNGYMKVYSKENSAKRIGDRIKKVRQERDEDQKVSNCLTTFRSEENLAIETGEKCKEDGKRKHHRLWTISEIKKLIEGVSQHGVGRWTDIKRLYFSMSNHRTSVDLKDKWRNLLKASRLQKQSTTEGGHRRNLAWRPLPHTILNRVNDLATIYPYPRTHKSKIVQVDHDSSPILMLTGASGVTE